MNKLFFILLITLCEMSYAQQKKQPDLWTGSYLLHPKNGDTTTNADTLVIVKTADANPKDIPAKYESDLARWALTSKKEGDKEKKIVRRFLFDVENDEDAYKEFGWTDLHKSGKMNCIDGGHFFICQTEPNTTVRFNKEETYLTETGVFGIWLHYGVVELQKIK
jgi:hypothetical protein